MYCLQIHLYISDTSTILSNRSFQCRITKPILLLIIHFCGRVAVETSDQPKVKAVKALNDQKADKISDKGHSFLYIKQISHSHLCYIYVCQAFYRKFR